jgi:hypothetical protein
LTAQAVSLAAPWRVLFSSKTSAFQRILAVKKADAFALERTDMRRA